MHYKKSCTLIFRNTRDHSSISAYYYGDVAICVHAAGHPCHPSNLAHNNSCSPERHPLPLDDVAVGITAQLVTAAPLPAPPSVPQPSASVAVPTSLFFGNRVLPLPQRIMKKILALEFVEMRELLPEEWLGSVEEGEHSEQHSCCNSTSRKRKAPVTNIFTWLQGYASLVGALSTASQKTAYA